MTKNIFWNDVDRGLAKPLVKIAIPIMLGQFMGYLLNLADSIMIGRIGETEYSAVALANQPFFVVFLSILGLAGGMGMMIGQYFGKGDSYAYQGIVASAVRWAIVITGIATIVVQIAPMAVMSVFTPDVAMQQIGADYLKIVSFSYIFAAFSNIMYSATKNVGNTKFGMYGSAFSVITNIILNYCLIFGKLGFPELGVEGAALATLIARILEFSCASYYFFKVESVLKIKFSKILSANKAISVDFVKYAIPVLVSDALWGLLFSTHLMIVGRIGQQEVAAWTICSTIQQLSYIVTLSLGNACAVIFANTVGAGNYDKVRQYTKSALKISLYNGIFGAVLLYSIAPLFTSFYNVSAEAVELVGAIFMVLPFIYIIKSVAAMIIIAVLRGSGDLKIGAIIDVAPMLIVIPIGYVIGVVMSLDLWIVYICLMSDELIKVLIGLYRIKHGDYIKNITKD